MFTAVVWLASSLVRWCNATGVPARLGKGQGAKEIWHNLACERPKFVPDFVSFARMTKWSTLTHERPKFGHNPTREWNEVLAQFCGQLMKTWVQICKQLQAFLYRLFENTKTAITFCKKKKKIEKNNLIFFFFFLIRAGRWIIGHGARQYGQDAAPSEICLAGTLATSRETAGDAANFAQENELAVEDTS